MKVNDYVRTETGDIGKIISEGIVNFLNKRHIYKNFNELKKDKDIIKSSSNIIDVIEVGDYVNGQQVCLIDDEYIVDDEIKTVFFTNKNYSFAMFEEDIKSIVTKEQFENIQYKIK